MTGGVWRVTRTMKTFDRLESFEIYRLACQVFGDWWDDSEIIGKDYRGRELVKQQTRSLDSVCANIEEGYGRGFGKELPQHLKIARGEARESLGRYYRCNRLLPAETTEKRAATLNHIIGGLTKTINTIETRRNSVEGVPSRHSAPATRHTL